MAKKPDQLSDDDTNEDVVYPSDKDEEEVVIYPLDKDEEEEVVIYPSDKDEEEVVIYPSDKDDEIALEFLDAEIDVSKTLTLSDLVGLAKRDYIEVVDMSVNDVCLKIQEILQSSRTGEDYNFRVPRLTKKQTVYNERLRRLVLKKRYFIRSTKTSSEKEKETCSTKTSSKKKKETLSTKTSSKKKKETRSTETDNNLGKAMLHVLQCIVKCCSTGARTTLRSVYYENRDLFKSQKRKNKVLDEVAAMVGCTRHSLHVDAVVKGEVIGSLKYRVAGDWFDCCPKEEIVFKGSEICLRLVNCMEDISTTAEFILLVENFSAYASLLTARVWEKFNCIIVTGKGYADIATRTFLRKIQKVSELPIYALVDCDIHGFKILAKYRYGAIRTAYDGANLAIPNIRWLGLRPTDMVKFDITGGRKIKTEDMDACFNLLKNGYVKDNPCWGDELRIMMSQNNFVGIDIFNKKVSVGPPPTLTEPPSITLTEYL